MAQFLEYMYDSYKRNAKDKKQMFSSILDIIIYYKYHASKILFRKY
jgi:hypothetical protein